ncbi:hypothetical protein AB0E82_39575 [Streptomyces anulatus]|uniref:hypothetical protein n=1 Tax=Streptomyces anulatus TaxID=1892 RepID=UPI00340BEFF7
MSKTMAALNLNAEPGFLRTVVTIDGTDSYEAVLHPERRWNGFVSPFFTLDEARKLASDTLTLADQYGYDCADTVHVIDGGAGSDGAPRAVVLHVRWMYLEDEGPTEVTTVITPTADGRYLIGGWEWTWSIQTRNCPCGAWNDHHVTPCPACDREGDPFALAA